MIGLIALYIYLSVLWKRNFSSIEGRISFSKFRNAAIFCPSLDMGEKFSSITARAVAKFIWYIIFAIALLFIKSHSIDRVIMIIYGVIFAPTEIMGYQKLKHDLREFINESDVLKGDDFRVVKKANIALLLYQAYLFIALLMFWY